MNGGGAIDRDYAVALLRHMVEIPSVSGQERVLALCLQREMERLHYRSYLDEAGNAVGELGDGGPLIMLLGHMDTVPGLIPVRQEGRSLYGRGAVDAKGALAVFICAAAAAARGGCRVVVVGAIEEETPASRGAHCLLDRFAPDAVIVGEPSGWANVVIGYKGRIGFSYTVTRARAHDAAAADNAAEVAAAFWGRLVKHLEATAGNERIFYRPTATLRRFDGRGEEARLDVSCRIPPGFEIEALKGFLTQIGGDGRLEFDELTPAALMRRTAPPVRALSCAIRRHGGKPGLRVKTGTSDMNIVCQRWRAPMAAYGPGDSALDHTSDEHVDLDEYLLAVEVLADALGDLGAELKETVPQETAPAPVPAAGAPPAASAPPAPGFTEEEEAEVNKRLQALGYLE
jgi:LysW-gamma-L-lysine carboxypeptidase